MSHHHPVAILLVDDEAKNLVALESILESPDYELVKAQTANAALLALMERDYAAIVLDVQMPEIDGIELARLIKQRKKTQHIPILFLTAYYQADEHIVQGYGAGAVDYLTKPVNPDVLRSKIGVFLDLFQKTRALATVNQAMTAEIAEREKMEAALRTAYAELEQKNLELENQAEERARRIRAEAAQAQAEAATARAALLAEASKLFALTMDPAETMRALTQLVVPRIADFCIITSVAPDDQLVPLALFHTDPAAEAQIRRHLEDFPQYLSETSHSATVLRTGQSIVCEDLCESQLASLTRGSKEAASVRSLGLCAFMCMPLLLRGRTIGTLTLAHRSARHYSVNDISLTESLAQRAAMALENARLYQEARALRESAEAANAAKDRFLAMLSHELRTPLSPVLHAVTLLDEEPDVPPAVREILSTIHRNVQLEARLIDDLLDLARIRNGKLQLQPQSADVHELLLQAAEICRPEILRREQQLSVELRAGSTAIWADPARIQQIFWNLISNATKFTPRGGQISLRSVDGPDGTVILEVSDTGRGIAPDRLGKIFDAFEQGDRHRSTGLGLGLAICKALAELHRGSIQAASSGWEAGSTFTVQLPVTPAAAGARVEQPPDPASLPAPRLRLLLVEDHADTANMLQRLLLRRGFEVRAASSVADALSVASQYKFDVLVSDIGLPDGTGMDLFGRLVEQRGHAAFHGIALSGFGMHEDLERSRAAGFTEHLTKPVDFALLERTLARLAPGLPA